MRTSLEHIRKGVVNILKFCKVHSFRDVISNITTLLPSFKTFQTHIYRLLFDDKLPPFIGMDM